MTPAVKRAAPIQLPGRVRGQLDTQPRTASPDSPEEGHPAAPATRTERRAQVQESEARPVYAVRQHLMSTDVPGTV